MRPTWTLVCLICVSPALAAEVTVLGLFKDRAVLMVDGKRRVLERGQTSPEGVLLLSADSEAAVLEVDGKQARYSLGNHIGATFAAPSSREVQLWPDRAGMYRSPGAINNQSVNFLVDTGATWVAMNANQARRLGIDYRLLGTPGTAETASGKARFWGVTLESVRIGEIVLRNIPAAVLDGPQPSDVLLGMSFLKQLEMERQSTALVLRQKM